AVPDGDLGRLLGDAVLPAAAAIVRAADVEADLVRRREVERLADEVCLSVGTEAHVRVAAGVVDAGARDGRIVRVLRDRGKEAVRQRGSPGLPAIEARIHRAAVVVV